MSESVVRNVPWMQSGWRWLPLSFALVVFDQWTKGWIERHYELGEYTPVFFWLDIIRLHNPGAAFSFLADAGGWQRWFFSAIGIVASFFILWLLRSHPTQKLFCFALALVLGGAVGNVIDRIAYGHVIDFLDFHWDALSPVFFQGHFPAFNVADSAISMGAVCLILDELIRVRRGT